MRFCWPLKQKTRAALRGHVVHLASYTASQWHRDPACVAYDPAPCAVIRWRTARPRFGASPRVARRRLPLPLLLALRPTRVLVIDNAEHFIRVIVPDDVPVARPELLKLWRGVTRVGKVEDRYHAARKLELSNMFRH